MQDSTTMTDRYRPTSPFARAFAAEYKGYMRSNGVTNLQIAEALGRNDGYVSERANGRRPLDTDDVDALASLTATTGRELMILLATRARGQRVVGVGEDIQTITEDEAIEFDAVAKGEDVIDVGESDL